MDIGRTMLLNNFARHRLDAGTFGTMGVGLGFAIAAALYCKDSHPNKRVICVEGDSAFGFSGMEIETMFRFVHFADNEFFSIFINVILCYVLVIFLDINCPSLL